MNNLNEKTDSKGRPWPSFDQVPENKDPDFRYYQVYDSKTAQYRLPFPAINEHDVIRQFIDLFRGPMDEKNQYLTNPEDFQIFEIGCWSKKTGEFTPFAHRQIAKLLELQAAARSRRPIGSTQPQQGVWTNENSVPQRVAEEISKIGGH